MKMIIITNGLIDVASGKVFDNQAIYLNKNEIVSIIEIDQVPVEDLHRFPVIDAKSSWVMPGLIDSHLHLNFSAGDTPLQDFLQSDNDQLYATSLENCRKAILAGITTVRDCGSISDVVLQLRKESAEGTIAAPHIMTSGEAITTTNGHISFVGLEADSIDEMKKAADVLIKKGVDFIKLIISGGNMTPGSSDLTDQYTPEQIKEFTEYVHQKGLKVMAHIHTKEAFTYAIDAGIDYFEHGSWRVEGGIEIDETEIDRMFTSGLVYCTALPKSYTVSTQPAHMDRITATIKNMKHKSNVVLGTDAGTTNNSADNLVNQAVFLKEKGDFSTIDLIRMMTIQPGRLLGLEKTGEVKEGYIADLLILKKNPLTDLANLRELQMVIKDGRIMSKKKM